jgi:DNA-binding NarL/FixJ family response regulator
MRQLTERQREVLTLIAQGNRLKQVAPLLGITESAVEDAIVKIKRNLGASTLPHAVLLGVGAGILDAPAVALPPGRPIEAVRAAAGSVREIAASTGVHRSSVWRMRAA